MTNLDLSPTPIKHLIGGRWECGSSTRFGDVYNPSTGRVIARVPFASAADVDAAVQAASDTLTGWADTPVVERARVFFRYRQLLADNAEALARTVTREH